ncbi:IclR family transcriptional regulator [Pseudarthrobacter cellobiosi]|uniref:IclR family transcriptional regulator n=1 Tax=Pseudarthrobacter cellobiosi TaxID=2953654 RepID=UPI00208F449D|nr:IclR family transcriptional regulator [Pseudarthrobacter sp. HLT1-5]MCO4255081.1 IclR family transcriptional regulator [Pseudarthrobacter sp. HLT1-5]
MTTPDSNDTNDTNGSDSNGKGDTKGASVIVNAIAVLRTFTADEPLLGVTEIANRVGLHKSTVSRILSTFEQEHLVERDADTRRFRLGLGLIAVAGPLLAELEERRVAYPVLRELTELTGETSALMMWEGNESICVEQIASRHQIKHTAPLGARYSDALSSSVQVFLGMQPEERVRALLRSGAITYPGLDDASLEDYLLRLKDDSRRGWAINYGESSMDEVGVAAPVYDHRGDLVAAVLIPAPRFRVSKERLQSLGESCRAAADKVTARLGGNAPGTIKRSLT